MDYLFSTPKWNNTSIDLIAVKHHDLQYHRHIHRNHEIVIVHEGTLNVGLNRRNYHLHAGQAMFIEPYEPHAYLESGTNKVSILEFQTMVYPTFTEWLRSMRVDERIISVPDQTMAHFLATVQYDNYGHPCLERLQAEAYIHSVITPFCYLFMTHCRGVRDSKKYDDDFIHALNIIEDHITEPLSLAYVSQMLGICRETLCRKFKERSHMTFLDYVQFLRVYHAAERMHDGVSVTQAALESGFGSVRTFNRVFLQVMGCTPTEHLAQISDVCS